MYELTEQEQRIAISMRHMWEEVAYDLLQANAYGKKGDRKFEMRRSEVISVMSDYYVSNQGHASSGYGDVNYQQEKADSDYFWKLPYNGKVRKAIYEKAFPSCFKYWGM